MDTDGPDHCNTSFNSVIDLTIDETEEEEDLVAGASNTFSFHRSGHSSDASGPYVAESDDEVCLVFSSKPPGFSLDPGLRLLHQRSPSLELL